MTKTTSRDGVTSARIEVGPLKCRDNSVTSSFKQRSLDVTPSSPDLAASVDIVRTTWITSHLESLRICIKKQQQNKQVYQLLAK